MSTQDFEHAIRELGARLGGRRVQAPSEGGIRWRVESEPSTAIVATMPAELLGHNIQRNSAAVPTFAFCFAFWFELFNLLGEGRVSVRVEIEGELPTHPHVQRSLFLLHELQQLLGERFTYTPELEPSWPKQPSVNEATAERASDAPLDGSERGIECAFVRDPAVAEQFARIEPIAAFRRQLPLGLFDGRVAKANRWTPGASSQVDLWAVSADGRTVHLFELKKTQTKEGRKTGRNVQAGILAEALWYARVLHRIRIGDFGGKAVVGGGRDMDRIRGSERLQMWLLVEEPHPLLLHGERSPLEWLRAGLAGSGLDLGILPYRIDQQQISLRVGERWPR